MNRIRALFLDRDGVINVDHGYVHTPEQFEFVPGIFDLCRHAIMRGFHIVVVTNQAGIGRGLFTEEHFRTLTGWMRGRFEAEGVAILDVYHCPSHPEHGIGEYRTESEDRKPNPGMFLRAARDHAIDMAASVALGDKAGDLEAAFAAGVETRLLLRSEKYPEESTEHATHVVDDLAEAVDIVATLDEPAAVWTDDTEEGQLELARCREMLQAAGYMVQKIVHPSSTITDQDLYAPYANAWATFQPWMKSDLIEDLVTTLLDMKRLTLVTRDRLWVLKTAFEQTRTLRGEIWEAGVFQGGTALMLRRLIEACAGADASNRTAMRLFDTFQGMPATRDDLDLHREGDFSDTSLDAVKSLVGNEPWIDYRPGLVPDTFAGLGDCTVRLAHVDLDIYEGILSACEFIYPRLVPGGMMVFDDYGFWTCPGARAAVDRFFADKPERPLALPTGQAIVSRLPPAAVAPEALAQPIASASTL